MILNRAKDYNENDKKRFRTSKRFNKEIYLNKKKIETENMEKIDISICLKKRKKKLKEYQKNYVEQKNLSIIINRIVF